MTIFDDIRTKADEILNAATVAEGMYITASSDLDTALTTIDTLVGERNAARQERDAARSLAQLLQAQLDECRAGHPDPEPVEAKIGAAFKSGENLPSVVKTIDVHRHFFQPGDMSRTQTWSGEDRLVRAYDQYGCRTFSISFKPDQSGTSPFTNPGNIERFLDTIPADVDPADVLLTFFHEHDGNLFDRSLSLSTYRAGSDVVAGIAESRGMGFGPIHNAMVKKRVGTQEQSGIFPDVWAANEADVSRYTFWGVDCYSPTYQDPYVRMAPIATYAKSLGLPVLIGELAAPPDDPTRQATWARYARAWCRENTRWACWWSSQISGKPDWRLTDAAAREWFGL